MYNYSLAQWILFFFWYCFLGWIWECLYVSVKYAWKRKKWEFINRGFLHGPLIPIYGFSAIMILLTTIRWRENAAAIYIIGALTATLFELVTGTVMERLFGVKYWDYSNLPLNYKGHISVIVSLFWGLLSVLLIQVIHVPVERVLLQIPVFFSELIVFLLIAVTSYDTATSFNEAMDLRKVLESLSDSNETIKRLERRFEAIIAFTPIPDMDDWRHLKLSAREKITYNMEKLRWKNEERINRIKDYLQLPEVQNLADRVEILEKLEMHRKSIREQSNKQFFRAMKQLKRNPGVRSEKHQEILDLLGGWLRNL